MLVLLPDIWDMSLERKGGSKIKTESSDTLKILSETVSKVRVQFFGTIGLAARKKGDEVELPPDTTICGLLRGLADSYGKSFREELFDDSGLGGLRDDVMVTLGGVIVNHANAARISLKPGDEISLFPVFPGGG